MLVVKELRQALVMLCVVTVCSGGEVRVYEASGDGRCGDTLHTITPAFLTTCAMTCTHYGQCSGFSFEHVPVQDESPSTGTCELHQVVTNPDGDSSITCYLPVGPPGNGATNSAPNPTVGTGAPAPTASNAPYSSTTGIVPPAPTAPNAAQNGPVAAVDTSGAQKVNVRNKQMCNSNGGAIGLIEISGTYYFLCVNTPNELPYSVQQPSEQCGNPSDHMACMTKVCGANEIFLGFRQAQFPSQGPCSDAMGQASVDSNDCHTVDGDLQSSASAGSWTQWRLCGGNRTAAGFYVITGAVVDPDGTGWTLTSITCCRVAN